MQSLEVNLVPSADIAKNLRVASLSVALYEFLITIPDEWRLYRKQSLWYHPSLACILFALIRYSSVLILVISNVGALRPGFSPAACRRYYLAAPMFKILQTWICQSILGIRTYNIARRRRWVGWFLIILFFTVSPMEAFVDIYKRVPTQNSSNNCSPGNNVGHLYAWIYYALSMFYDFCTLVISTFHLLKLRLNAVGSYYLLKPLFMDGMGYFAVLTVANIFNLILYRTSVATLQSSGASLGYVVIMIMAQRLLLSLQKYSGEAPGSMNVVVSHPPRFPQVSRPHDGFHLTSEVGEPYDNERHPSPVEPKDIESSSELNVRVRVERSMVTDGMTPLTIPGSTRNTLVMDLSTNNWVERGGGPEG